MVRKGLRAGGGGLGPGGICRGRAALREVCLRSGPDLADDIEAISPCGTDASRGFDGAIRDDEGARSNQVLEAEDDLGKRRSEADDDAGDQGTGQADGDHAGQDEEGGVDSRHPDGGRLHALLWPLERRMSLAGVLLAERLLQDQSLADGPFGSVTSTHIVAGEAAAKDTEDGRIALSNAGVPTAVSHP